MSQQPSTVKVFDTWVEGKNGTIHFDVMTTDEGTALRLAKEYWHFDLGGEVSVEDQEVLHDDIEEVRCRWCGATDTVEIVPRAGDAE